MFDKLTLREACNKIVHATTFEPHRQDASGSHRIDDYNALAWSEAMDHSEGEAIPSPDQIKWQHLSGIIRLGGEKAGEKWWHLLQVPMFVEAVYKLLANCQW
jgi:hypothetical protein